MMHLDVRLLLHFWLKQVFVQRYIDLSLSQHVLRFSLHITGSVQMSLDMRRDGSFCAKSVSYNIFTNVAP